jgi:hypothetical protein
MEGNTMKITLSNPNDNTTIELLVDDDVINYGIVEYNGKLYHYCANICEYVQSDVYTILTSDYID